MKTSLVFAAGALVSIQPVAAQYTPGAVMGWGATTCGYFAQQYAKSTQIEDAYFTWAQGYMSGSNVMMAITKAPLRDLTARGTEAQKADLRNYCSEHPLAEFTEAVAKLYVSLPYAGGR